MPNALSAISPNMYILEEEPPTSFLYTRISLVYSLFGEGFFHIELVSRNLNHVDHTLYKPDIGPMSTLSLIGPILNPQHPNPKPRKPLNPLNPKPRTPLNHVYKPSAQNPALNRTPLKPVSPKPRIQKPWAQSLRAETDPTCLGRGLGRGGV